MEVIKQSDRSSKAIMAAEATALFKGYDEHYQRMMNSAPDWDAAEAKPSKFAIAAAWLPQDRSARILDFGCGWGNLLMSLWAAGYRNLEGVELVEGQSEVAEKASAGRAFIRCVDGAEYLAEKIGCYDLIILSDVIEHIPKGAVVQVLRTIHCSLKPGGRLYIKTPNMASILASYSRYMDITHAAGYTEQSIVQLLDQTGFADHLFIEERLRQLSAWRPWTPWRGLGLAGLANAALHNFLYHLRRQYPKPKTFAFNLEVVSSKP